MEIKLQPAESEEMFYSALCNGLGYFSGYGLELDYNPVEYKSAKEKLSNPCYEDVLMQILRDGNELTAVDVEGDGDMTRSISLKTVHERMHLVPPVRIIEMLEETDDADTADAVLQTIFFESIIFG